ncbi:MAG: hypothetical protein QXG03_13315 [Halalkalicoccus sp.]
MSASVESLLDRVRQPEHTGANRCVPCTIANVLLALGASAVLALVSPPLGALALLASLGAISLRGYLVPGTPELTKRYLPERVLAAFDKDPREDGFETVERLEHRRRNAVDPEAFLLEVGAVEPCETVEDVCSTDEFDRLVERGTGRYRETVEYDALATLFGTEPGSIERLERPYPAFRIDRRVRKWPSAAALVADLAADDALRALTERWADVPRDQRLGILKSLRSFRERCPRCSGEIELSEGTVESCCRSYEVLALGCRDCGASLLEFNPEEVEPGRDETGIVS